MRESTDRQLYLNRVVEPAVGRMMLRSTAMHSAQQSVGVLSSHNEVITVSSRRVQTHHTQSTRDELQVGQVVLIYN